jgi:predicted Rossmann fold flavoprotein
MKREHDSELNAQSSVPKPRVVVVGGGAAGLLAAGRAAECGAEVTVIERGPILARKLRISGKGRGNITNTAEMKDFIAAFGDNGKFLYGAFSRFFRDDLLQLLKRLGVGTKVERGGRVFPTSDKAEDVAAALEKWIFRLGVTTKYNTRVKEILVEDGRAVGVNTYSGPILADKVILTTGGTSYPKTGSTGDGYTMAAAVGHAVIPPRPSLSALVAEEKWGKRLQGLSLRNVKATLRLADKKIAEEFGEMVFTHFGVSGPIILTLSRHAPEALKQGQVTLSINLKPALTEDQLDQRLIRDFTQKKHFTNYLPDLLPRSLIPVFVELTGIPGDTPVHKITAAQRKVIVSLLRDFRLTIRDARPVDEAIVTAGGVSIREIDPRTMESKLVKGLYFAGEVIDIDAITGGYNLQAAFSTGWVAGES